jgi:ATPase subunit of ABC transporter with duplicated ATPase domains
MIEIALKDLEKYYGANHVLKGVTFEVMQGERLGLLGKNGTGKTTLFKIIAGPEKCDSGALMMRKGASVGILDQIPQYPEGLTAYDVLYTAFEELHQVHAQMKEIERLMSEGNTGDELIKKYGRLQQAFEAQNGYLIEESIARVCTGLKIDSNMNSTGFNDLSGGEKTRVTLGRLILRNPDILLLDEPTNHLDLNSVEWLEDFLGEYKGTIVIISHDRYFLDRVVNRIVELVDGKAELYEGNYSYYAREKEERYLNQLQKYEQEQKKIKQLEAAAKRMHEWAILADSRALHRRAFSIEKRIERMDKTDKPVKEQGMKALFNENEFSGNDVITVRGAIKSFSELKVLNGVNLSVRKGEIVAVLGDNGSGKSTLIKIITGELKPDSGFAKMGESIRYAYLPQHVAFEEPELSILDTVRNALKLSEGNARELLARYKYRKDDIYKTVKNLSGGEKSRLRLCIQMQNDVNLLLLDEPTNHLDIQSLEWLEDALSEFGGTIVFVSHDRYFINRFATRICELKDGRIMDYYGDYEFFKGKKLEAQEKEEAILLEHKNNIRREPLKQVIKTKTEDEGEAAVRLEERISGLEARLASIDDEMQAHADNYEKLEELYKEKLKAEEELEGLYGQWEALNDIHI